MAEKVALRLSNSPETEAALFSLPDLGSLSKGLVLLDLSGVPLGDGVSFDNLTRLETLILNRCRISTLSGIGLESLTMLSRLEVCGNPDLSELPESVAAGAGSLLRIADTAIEFLPPGLPASLMALDVAGSRVSVCVCLSLSLLASPLLRAALSVSVFPLTCSRFCHRGLCWLALILCL